jgi:hypothetical protein
MEEEEKVEVWSVGVRLKMMKVYSLPGSLVASGLARMTRRFFEIREKVATHEEN